MSGQPEIDALRRRQALGRRRGGPGEVRRQHDGGNLTVRERIDRLPDVTASDFVCGRGRIDGRPVVAGGDDFTVRGAAADAAMHDKQVIAEVDDLGIIGLSRVPVVVLGLGSAAGRRAGRRSFGYRP